MVYIVPEGTGPIHYENMRPSEYDEINGRRLLDGRQPIDVFSIRPNLNSKEVTSNYTLPQSDWRK